MKSMQEIDINFTMATKKAEELYDIAAELRRMAEQTQGETIDKVCRCWKGQSSRMYCSKVNRAADKLIKRAISLEQIAEAIKKISESTYNAEVQAYELAQERLYNE